MRILILLGAIILLYWAQGEHRDGNAFNAIALMLLGVLIVLGIGCSFGSDLEQEAQEAQAELDEPDDEVGGTGA